MNTIYKVLDSMFVKSINPLVLTTEDDATQFEDAQEVAQGLDISEGEAFRVGRPGDRQPK